MEQPKKRLRFAEETIEVEKPSVRHLRSRGIKNLNTVSYIPPPTCEFDFQERRSSIDAISIRSQRDPNNQVEILVGTSQDHTHCSNGEVRSVLRKRLCMYRQHGCLFEGATTQEVSIHLEKECPYHKIKDYIISKEEELFALKTQMKRDKQKFKERIRNVEEQVCNLNNHIIEMLTRCNRPQIEQIPSEVISPPANTEAQDLQLQTKIPSKTIRPKDVTGSIKSLVNAKMQFCVEGHQQLIASMVADDRFLYSGSGDSSGVGCLKVWNLDDFTLKTSVDDCGVIYSMVLHEGKVISGGMSCIKIWDCETMNLFYCLEGSQCHNGEVKCLALAGNYLLSGAVDGLVKIWDIHKLKCIFTLKAHQNQIIAIELVLTESGSLSHFFTASHDSTIKIWNDRFHLVHTFLGHTRAVRSLVRCDNILISGSDDGFIRMWDWVDHKEIHSIPGLPPISVLLTGQVSETWILFSGHANGVILIWDLGSLQCLQVLSAHTNKVRSLCGANKMLISASYDRTIKAWQC